MSCQGTWADAIVIQAVANCLNLSIHIAESNEKFAPVTIVQPPNRGCTDIYIGHIGETHCVSTQVKNSVGCGQTLVGDKPEFLKEPIDKKEKRRAYIKEYMKKKRTDVEFRKRENEKFTKGLNVNGKQRIQNT